MEEERSHDWGLEERCVTICDQRLLCIEPSHLSLENMTTGSERRECREHKRCFKHTGFPDCILTAKPDISQITGNGAISSISKSGPKNSDDNNKSPSVTLPTRISLPANYSRNRPSDSYKMKSLAINVADPTPKTTSTGSEADVQVSSNAKTNSLTIGSSPTSTVANSDAAGRAILPPSSLICSTANAAGRVASMLSFAPSGTTITIDDDDESDRGIAVQVMPAPAPVSARWKNVEMGYWIDFKKIAQKLTADEAEVMIYIV